MNFSAMSDMISSSKSNKPGHMHFLSDKFLPILQIQSQSPCSMYTPVLEIFNIRSDHRTRL